MKDLGIADTDGEFEGLVSRATVSDRGREEILSNGVLREKAIGHHVYEFCYTDYGGDVLDKIVASDVLDHHLAEDGSFPAYHEPTSYDGANCLVFGQVADDIHDEGDDPYGIARVLGFDLDDELGNLQENYVREALDAGLEDDVKSEFGLDDLSEEQIGWLWDWLYERADIHANSLDFSTRQILEDFGRRFDLEKA